MTKIVLIILSVCVLGLPAYFGCDKGTEPPKPVKNPRDYTWTADTLIAHPDAIQTEMWDIYATGPQNVYVAGHTDWTGINGNGILWRYDGTKWSIINQGFKDISLESITGFGPSDIYAAGNKGPEALILHFDGANWTQTILSGRPLFAIRGSSSSNIWAGGWMGTAFRFDGNQWSKIPLNERLSIRYLIVDDGRTYATAYRVGEQFPADSIAWFFLRWNTSTWDTLDTYVQIAGQPTIQTFGSSLSVVGGELYSGGKCV